MKASDKIAFSSAANNLIGGGNATLQITQAAGFSHANTYTIFQNTTTAGFTLASITGYDTTNYTANFAAVGNDYQLSFVAVPEPSTYALLGMGLAGVVAAMRRRKA